MSSISNLSDISSLSNGDAKLTLDASGAVEVNQAVKLKYLTINPADSTNEGGEFFLRGYPPLSPVVIDNYQGNARVITSGGDYGLMVVTVDGTTIIRGNHIDNTDWIAPTFVNSWTNYAGGTTFNTAAYFKDKLGIVHIRGMISSGTASTTIFTLPAGYRPPYRVLFGTISDTGTGRIDVDTSGNVIHVAGGNGWITLDSLKFRAA